MTSPDKIIEEVLRHDAAMTKGPWGLRDKMAFPTSNREPTRTITAEGGYGVVSCKTEDFPDEENAAGIAMFRTAAPTLARALKVALEEMRKPAYWDAAGVPVYSLRTQDALFDITKILGDSDAKSA